MFVSDHFNRFTVRQLRRGGLICIALIVVGVTLCSVAPRLLSSAQQNITWRYTRLGWQDSARWTRQPDIPFERRIELIHPAAVSAIILLSAFGMLLWAADEHDVARLLEGTDKVCRRAKPRSPCIDDYLD